MVTLWSYPVESSCGAWNSLFSLLSDYLGAVLSDFYRKIHCMTSEFIVKFHAKNRYRTKRELNRIAKATWAKPNVLYFCEPRQCANNGNPFEVNVNVVLLSVSDLLNVSNI